MDPDDLPANAVSHPILACVIDIIVALIPASLLWNLQITLKTKITLHTIFALGFLTALLSIGRAVTTNFSALQQDFTCEHLPSRRTLPLPLPSRTSESIAWLSLTPRRRERSAAFLVQCSRRPPRRHLRQLPRTPPAVHVLPPNREPAADEALAAAERGIHVDAAKGQGEGSVRAGSGRCAWRAAGWG